MKQKSTTRKAETFYITPVGYVRRKNGRTVLDILPAFVPALKELEHFSHVQVLWWFSQFEDEVHRQTTHFKDAPFDAPVLGIFACRAPTRPNPIGLTTARILHVDHAEGHIEIADIDAFDGTPILDLKAYLPVCDRVQNMRVPNWASDWPQWLPEDGLGIEEETNDRVRE